VVCQPLAKFYERQRRVILSAGMMAVHGRIQREREVVHLVAHRVSDLSESLASVGSRDTPFPMPHGSGDEVHANPGPDQCSPPPEGQTARDIRIPDLTIKVKARDFR
jgi:error-prone DNA polymerase